MRLYRPERLEAPQITLNPKSIAVRSITELPLHRKWGFTPTTFIAMCCVFLALLWFLIFEGGSK
jgi:hypothetical protein